tara:strand:- start:234 stop:635 length:402 start_codon:yes stop_codon:yes gene_type:complete
MINWAVVEGVGRLGTAWEGDYDIGDTVTLHENQKFRLVELYREDHPDSGPATRHWVVTPDRDRDIVPAARRCLICDDLAASQDMRCGCSEGCTDLNLLSFLCISCLDADTGEVAQVRDHVQRANALWYDSSHS